MRNVTISLAMVLLLAGPTAALAKVKVVTTLADLGWIVETVGGDRVEVQVLCPGNRDPHSMPAKPSLARKLGKADLLVYNGLELEIGWLPLLVDAARNNRIKAGKPGELNASLALAPDEVVDIPHGEVDRSGGDIHPLGNPHFTLDPRLGGKVGHLIAHRLAVLDPQGMQYYAQRADDLDHLLVSKLGEWEKRVRDLDLVGIIVYHQQWEYLLAWLGPNILATIENRPGIAPSPRHVEEVVKLGRRSGRVVVLAATWDHKDGANHVSRKVPCPLVVVPASTGAEGADGYIELFEPIVSQLEGGM